MIIMVNLYVLLKLDRPNNTWSDATFMHSKLILKISLRILLNL